MTLADDRALERFPSYDPATGEVLAHLAGRRRGDRRRGRRPGPGGRAWWADLGFDGRRERLLAWKGVITRRMRELAQLMHRENGKPVADAAARDHRSPSTTSTGRPSTPSKVLGPRRVRPRPAVAQPAGLARVPAARRRRRHRPVELPGVHADGLDRLRARRRQRGRVQAERVHPGRRGLARATRSPRSCPSSRCCRSSPATATTGAALCRAGVDKIAFTGSTATGKKIMAACAETLTPVLIECGGKDAMIVDADADLDAAADARRLGRDGQRRARPASASSGSTSSSRSTTRSCDKLVREGRGAAAGRRPDASYGPITMPGQLDVIRRHIDDALARGGRAVRRRARRRCGAPYVDPTVLVDVPEDSPGGARGDVRPDAVGQPGARRRRGGRAGQRVRLRAGRRGLRQAARRWSSPGGCAPA